ncbi:Sugar phosphate isomerase/epimerase [Actinopolymorpha cephalotaxi]|uniref:Sugar phosphate isomerase/epimerase n=1 Tax=Actinopolymorpha cephalotaxi TaxID=504797 RepID=A0A1I2TMN3_9ACTN|nr:sugar phosphate isomerase/epimerase family protein [Actinopolymorpha cephalotaxi]NYH83150.1 sugar phosphate isomerase/epimerase [Actinopolymorpha cephalotaxi]SFG66172.1 Sugar phosphate isomerase/epimerase [Actinopolymorpha cephalotaxi]
MKLSFSTLGCPNYTLDQVLSTATGNGYDGVELRFLRGEVGLHELEEFSAEGLPRTRARFEQAGVELACLDTSVRFTSPDKDERARQLESARTYARIAAGLGSKYIRVFGGTVPDEGPELTETTKRIAEGLAEAAAATRAEGVTAVLETHDSFCTSAQVGELLSYAPNDDLGILWDVLHSYRNGEPLEQTWQALGERIRHVHLKDSGAYSPTDFDFRLTGEGTMPIGEFVGLLDREGYTGYLSFEWEKAWHPEIEEPEVAIPQYAEYMRKLVPAAS